jgi:RNA polymerase sigma-70 factor (ECF subfamily)
VGDPSDRSGSTFALEPGASQTDWSLIAAAVVEPDFRGSATERLSRRYWPAIYAYCRSMGLGTDEASDVTQGFICDVVLERGLLAAADPARGRFRNLLLTALANYVRDRHRWASRARRAPSGGPPLSLDGAGLPPAASPGRTPEQAFTAQWASVLVRDVLEQVRRACLAGGLDRHWTLFEQRVARPMLHGGDPTPYESLIRQLGIKDVGTAANMVITVKRRVAAGMREEVARTVEQPAEVDAELRELLRVLEWGT